MPMSTTKFSKLGLDNADYDRLCSWIAEIAVERSPRAQVRRSDGETRIDRKGSLVVYPDGHWHSFEADEWEKVHDL